MACEWIAEASGTAFPQISPTLAGCVAPERWQAVARIAGEGVASPITTSVGRLCDAVAAICGAGERVSYEGQAAIELEACAEPGERGRYELPFAGGVLDARATIAAVLGDVVAGVRREVVSARFHNTLAAATAQACVQTARERGVPLVVLGGGVFQNRLLLEGTARAIVAAGLRVLAPQRLPANDGGISFGQAAIAATASRSAAL